MKCQLPRPGCRLKENGRGSIRLERQWQRTKAVHQDLTEALSDAESAHGACAFSGYLLDLADCIKKSPFWMQRKKAGIRHFRSQFYRAEFSCALIKVGQINTLAAGTGVRTDENQGLLR